MYVLFLYQEKLRLNFLGIETPKLCDTKGFFDCIIKTFKRIGFENFTDWNFTVLNFTWPEWMSTLLA